MAFQTIQKLHIGRPGHRAPPVQIARQKNIGVVVLATTITKTLGWEIKDKIEIALGTGDDSGLIALRKGPDGYVLGANGAAKTTQYRVSARQLFKNISHLGSTECKFEIVNGTLYIRLPSRLLSGDASASAGIPVTRSMVAAE